MSDETKDPGAPLLVLKRRVILDVPFVAETKVEQNQNLAYLQACVADCLLRGEAPFAAPALVAGAAVDEFVGLVSCELDEAWAVGADAIVTYADRGPTVLALISEAAQKLPHETRTLGPKWLDRVRALPIYLERGDSALIWESRSNAPEDNNVAVIHFDAKDKKKPMLYLAMSFALMNAALDSRLQREIERFVERVNRVAGEIKARAALAEKLNRS